MSENSFMLRLWSFVCAGLPLHTMPMRGFVLPHNLLAHLDTLLLSIRKYACLLGMVAMVVLNASGSESKGQ